MLKALYESAVKQYGEPFTNPGNRNRLSEELDKEDAFASGINWHEDWTLGSGTDFKIETVVTAGKMRVFIYYQMHVEKEPPMLSISTGETKIQAVRLTYSWQDRNYGVEADALHPLEMADQLPILDVPTDGIVKLTFEKAPDRIEVWAWKTSAAGTDVYDKPDHQLSVSEECTVILPSDDTYLYEVHAIWDTQNDIGGAAYYGFASKKNLSN